jgi:hypothetical protein
MEDAATVLLVFGHNIIPTITGPISAILTETKSAFAVTSLWCRDSAL